MRITVFTQFFPPEIGATQTRLELFAAGLAARGHEVEVICEVPNHPQGIVHNGFERRPLVQRSTGGYRATHVWVYTSPNKTTKTRVAFYGTYAAMATLVGAARRRPDVILASSPPLPVAAAAALVAARHRVPWVMDVRDLWPAAAVALGELSDPRALSLAERLERRLYASASAIAVATGPFEEEIASRSPSGKRIVVVPNGTTRFWLDAITVQRDRGALDLPHDRFIWTFAGNIGAAQGLEAAIDAAGLLDDRFSLLIVGDGPARAELARRADSNAPPGAVMFRDQVAATSAREYLWASDALLVPLKADPILGAFVPSKLYDFCAVGRPVVVAAAGEPARLVGDEEAALSVPPGDSRELANAVQRLASDPALASRLGDAGRKFARANLRDAHVERLVDLVESTSER